MPSTPLPDRLISTSPAWDPSSRTPGRPLEEPEEANLLPLPSYRHIPKPKGGVNRAGGYYLHEILGIDKGEVSKMKVSGQILFIHFYSRTIQDNIARIVRKHFDLSHPYTQQSEQSRADVSEEVCGFSLTFTDSFPMFLSGHKTLPETTRLRE